MLLHLFTHLCFCSSCLLDETSRHGGADREALKEASQCITETQSHQLLQQCEHRNTKNSKEIQKEVQNMSIFVC